MSSLTSRQDDIKTDDDLHTHAGSFMNQAARKEALEVSSFQNQVPNKSLQCKFCNQQYAHKSSLSRHVNTVHSDRAGMISCELCTQR